MENRHRALYEYLLDKGDTWTSQSEVARDLYKYFGNGECFFEPDEYHDTLERHFLSKTIAEINEAFDYEKIIISSRKGIKLANEEEFERYIKNLYSSVFKKLRRVRIMEKKGNANGQIDFNGDTVEAFLDIFENPLDK
jgi:hypothetical protein